MEPQLSKQVVNMLSGSSCLTDKHIHTLAPVDIKPNTAVTSCFCVTEEEIETGKERFPLEDKTTAFF